MGEPGHSGYGRGVRLRFEFKSRKQFRHQCAFCFCDLIPGAGPVEQYDGLDEVLEDIMVPAARSENSIENKSEV